MSLGKEVFIAAIIILTFFVIAVSVISAVSRSWPTLPAARAHVILPTEEPRTQEVVRTQVPTLEGPGMQPTTLPTSPPSETPQPAQSHPRYSAGDVLSGSPYGTTQGDVILSYSSATDRYRVQVVYFRDGEWVCPGWAPTIRDRTDEESARPYKVDKINPDYLTHA